MFIIGLLIAATSRWLRRLGWKMRGGKGRHCCNLAKMATSTLSNIFKAVKENLVPCPNNSCKGSNTQFYSAHGLEQHRSRFHKAPGCNFSQDKVVMGQNLLKKLHFDCVKELLDERFRTWSTRNKVGPTCLSRNNLFSNRLVICECRYWFLTSYDD